MAWWLAPLCFGAAATGALLTSLLTPGTTAEALLIFLPAIIGLSVMTIIWQISWRPHPDQLFEPDEEETESAAWSATWMRLQLTEDSVRPKADTITLFMAPSISIFGVLLLRLIVGQDRFQGDANQLDFGPLDGEEGGTPNIAFDKGAVGFSVLGTCAALLAFPAVQKCVLDLIGNRFRRVVGTLLELGSAAMTFYPSFYLIAFFWGHGGNYASSSYVSNAFEWSLSYCLGMSLGFFVTAPVQKHMWFYMDATQEQENKERPRNFFMGYVKMMQFMFGVLLLFTPFASAVLFGATWNTCVDDAEDCVNFRDDGDFNAFLASTFAALPLVVISISVLREWYIFMQEPPYGERV